MKWLLMITACICADSVYAAESAAELSLRDKSIQFMTKQIIENYKSKPRSLDYQNGYCEAFYDFMLMDKINKMSEEELTKSSATARFFDDMILDDGTLIKCEKYDD